MAYMTAYQLTVNTRDPQIVEKIQNELDDRGLIHEPGNRGLLGNIYNGALCPPYNPDDEFTTWPEAGMTTWPRHEQDLRDISKLLPDLLFELTGDDENNEMPWREYYQDGKKADCEVRIEFEEFDPSKLQ